MIQQRKIAKYVLLQIVTLGIYGLFFWSDWTEDLNKMCEDDDKESANYILVFLLDIFSLGIYSFVWNYAQAERMYRIAPQYGIELKHGGSYVLLLRTLLFFLPVFGSVERIKSFNALAVAYNATLSEEDILAAQENEKLQKKSKKEIKAEKKLAKKEAKANKKAAKNNKKAEKEAAKATKEDKKPIIAIKKPEKEAPAVAEEPIIPTDAVTLPGLTDDTMPDITTHAQAPIEEPVSQIEVPVEDTIEVPVEEVKFEAPVFERVEPVTYAPVVEKPDVEIPAVEEIVDVLIAEENAEAPAVTEEIAFSEPSFEVVDTETSVEFSAPEFEVVDADSADSFSEPVYEITDIEIPDIDFSDAASFEAPVEEVAEIKFDEPAAYEISTDIADVTFIDDEVLVPAAKEDILKQATKTVGTKRTVKEKVAKEPAEKKTTKSAEEKTTKATKAKKETAEKKETKAKTTKTTEKKETTSKTTKTTKAKKEVNEVKVEDLTFGEVEFEEVDLGADILSEIAEVSKSKK